MEKIDTKLEPAIVDGSELDILKIVADNPTMSQRKIAEQTGISLGQVNFLIKKCVKKGLLKIEGQTSKSLRYNLTPQGMAEKAARTLEYVKVSYAAVMKLTSQIKEIGKQCDEEGYELWICGSADEMMEICKLALDDGKIKYRILIWEQDENRLQDMVALGEGEKTAVLYWEMELPELLNKMKAGGDFGQCKSDDFGPCRFVNVLG